MTSGSPPSDDAVFLRARFAGGRFDCHSLPLELLPDLASYRRLIVEVAKHIFKSTHGDRVRVPKGFEESFQIAIGSVQGGQSSVAELVVPQRQQNLQPHLFSQHPEFEQARELISRVISTVGGGGKVPPDFPSNLVGLFNPFGQNLRPDEFVELNSPASQVVRYTDSIRRAIVLSSEQIIEAGVDAEFTLNGGLVHTGTIHVLDENGRTLDFQPASQFEFDEAYRRARGRVRLVGNGLFDQAGTLRRLLGINIDFNRPAFHLEVRSAFEEAAASVPTDDADTSRIVENLRSLRTCIEDSTDPNMELGRPFIYVLEDGEISVEWTKEPWEASIQMELSGTEFKLHALETSTGKHLWSKIPAMDGVAVRQGISAFFFALAPTPKE